MCIVYNNVYDYRNIATGNVVVRAADNVVNSQKHPHLHGNLYDKQCLAVVPYSNTYWFFNGMVMYLTSRFYSETLNRA